MDTSITLPHKLKHPAKQRKDKPNSSSCSYQAQQSRARARRLPHSYLTTFRARPGLTEGRGLICVQNTAFTTLEVGISAD